MKPIYFIRVYDHDYSSSWENDILHTTNKKFLEDLCIKFEKKNNYNTRSFHVLELTVVDNPTYEQVESEMKYLGLKS